MPLSFIQMAALVGIIIISIMFLLELRRWRLPGSVVAKRQRVLRAALLMLVQVLFVMVFAGSWVTSRGSIFAELVYWIVCVFLSLIVIVLALFDLRAVVRAYASLNRRVLDEMKEDERK